MHNTLRHILFLFNDVFKLKDDTVCTFSTVENTIVLFDSMYRPTNILTLSVSSLPFNLGIKV